MFFLRLFFENLPHPYADEPISKSEMWGKILIQIWENNTIIKKNVLNLEWDLIEFIRWFQENKISLFEEKFILNSYNSSIAESINVFYDKLDPDNEEDFLLDKIFEYKERHCLIFALQGAKDIPEIYIGIRNGNKTISRFDLCESWEFNVNLDSFYEDIKNCL
jgi:hypothetical protein